jgi:RNA polymerase sigma-70 factor, ECF subfamily
VATTSGHCPTSNRDIFRSPADHSFCPVCSRPATVVPVRPSDTLLVARLAHHDESALRDLVESYGRLVYAKALQVLRDANLAEEVAQDTLMLLWWEPHRFDGSKGSLRTFLMGVARFKAIDVVRREERARSRESLVGSSTFESPAADRGVADTIVVRAALTKLPSPKREVVFLIYYRGLTLREVADAMGIPVGTAKTRMRDSLMKLRTLMSRPESS